MSSRSCWSISAAQREESASETTAKRPASSTTSSAQSGQKALGDGATESQRPEMRVASDAADVAEALEGVRRLLAEASACDDAAAQGRPPAKRPARESGSQAAAKRPRQGERTCEEQDEPAEEEQGEAAALAEGAAPVAGDGGDEDGRCNRNHRQQFDYDIDVQMELRQRIPRMLTLRREMEDRVGVHFLLLLLFLLLFLLLLLLPLLPPLLPQRRRRRARGTTVWPRRRRKRSVGWRLNCATPILDASRIPPAQPETILF